jgi:hypothetical protein
MANALSEIVARHKRKDANTRFYIAALATKTQTLDAALFYLTECEGGTVSLIYPVCICARARTQHWNFQGMDISN